MGNASHGLDSRGCLAQWRRSGLEKLAGRAVPLLIGDTRTRDGPPPSSPAAPPLAPETTGPAGRVAPELVMDGEICLFDDQLMSQIHLLGRADPSVTRTSSVDLVFDCLYESGRDLRGLPLDVRQDVNAEIAGLRKRDVIG